MVVEDGAGTLPYVLVGVVEHPLERGAVGELLEAVELVDGDEANRRVRIAQGADQQWNGFVGWPQLGDRG